MIKIVFVDDEEVTLRLLTKVIDWERAGFRIVGTATDGKEGVELYKKEKPDVMIVDIMMPVMDGLEFIKEIRKIDTKAKIIILSAYDDFEYAQKAIPFGVSAYLLKPLDEIEMLKVLEDIKEDLLYGNRQNNDNMVSIELEFRKFLDAMRSKSKYDTRGMLERFPRLAVFSNYIAAHLKYLGLNIDNQDINKITDSIELLKTNICVEFKTKVFCTEINFGEYFLIIIFPDMDQAKSNMQRLVRTIEKYYKENQQQLDYTVGLSNAFAYPEDLKQAYKQALTASSFFFYPDSNRINTYQKINDYSLLDESYTLKNIRLVTSCLNIDNKDQIISVLKDLFMYFYSNKILPSHVYNFCAKYLFFIRKELISIYPNFDLKSLQNIFNQDLRDYYNFDLLRDFMVNAANKILEEIKIYKNGNIDMLYAMSAKKYTLENYLRKDFSTNEVAEYLGLSKNYFSKIFKDATGENFWDYVTRLRIEYAKRLLQNTDKTNYEISNLIGYKSEYHFSRKFKKLVGISPSQFRKL